MDIYRTELVIYWRIGSITIPLSEIKMFIVMNKIGFSDGRVFSLYDDDSYEKIEPKYCKNFIESADLMLYTSGGEMAVPLSGNKLRVILESIGSFDCSGYRFYEDEYLENNTKEYHVIDELDDELYDELDNKIFD